ncbi:hypothetical protein Tco_0478754 [Tanacetum coccineum]
MSGHGLLYIHALWEYSKTMVMNTMAEQNVPTQPPTRTDEQIVPRSQWLTIGKSNLLFNAQKIQKNPIFQISFWNTMKYNEKTEVYSCQVDEQWFDLSADLLRKALAITPVNPTHPFELPPSGNTVIDFVNELGYPEPVEIVSNIRVNYVYQPWRAILTLINPVPYWNKTFWHDNPDTQFCKCCGEFVTQTNVDHAELLWEEFTQGIQTFWAHTIGLRARVGCVESLFIINSSPHSLWTVFQGKSVELFGMEIPRSLITEIHSNNPRNYPSIWNGSWNTKKTPQERASMQPATKHATPKKPITTTPVKQSKTAPPPTKKPSKRKLPQKVRKGKPTFQLVDEDDEAQQESIPQEEGDDPDLELAKKMSLEAHQEKGEGEGDDADMERAIKLSLDPAFLPQGRAPVGGVTIRDPVSETTSKLHEVVGKGKAVVTEEQVAHSLIDLLKKKRTTDQFILVRRDQTPHDSTTGPSSQPEDDTSEKVIYESDSERTESETEAAAPKGDKDQGEVDMSTVTSGVSIPVSDPEKAHEALAGPDPEPMKEHQTGSDSGKLHVNVNSPVICPFTDVSSTKPSSLVTTPPINTEATTITTSLPKITLFIALQLRVARLEQEMTEVKKTNHSADILERHTADLIEKYSVLPGPESVKNQESKKSPKEIIRAKKEQGEEKQDSTYSIRSTDKVDLEEFDLKSALFKHMNKIKSANRNTANYHLYHALMEALIADEDAMDKEVADKVKDHKRKHDSDDDEDDDDDEGPSAGSNQGRSTKRRRSDSAASGSAQPPPKDDDQSSKKPRESDASASKQHPALTSTGWQITDTRDAGVDSSMHRSDPESEHSEQSSDDIPMQDEGNDSDMEDTDNAHIPKVSTTTWFKPIPESERPATPEPEWTIPPNDFPEPEINWANTYATTYQVPAENKLQRKTYDIGSFIKWFCRRTGKKKLCKADLEGPAFNLVKAFHKNNIFLQYQMDECHKLLTNKVDLNNSAKCDKERKIALSISKLKAARYLDFGLEELVPSLWVESEREYDISAVYGITHWWFRRKEFYINKHSEPSDREAVRSRMRILSVISVKVFEKYGYNYLREIILRRADYQEYKISEKDFKNLHPNDFEDLFLLNIQEKLNHLPKTDKTSLHTAVNMWIRSLVIRNRVGDLQLGIESYQTKINLERPNWDAADYYFKEDYTIVPKPRAVVYRDRNDQRKLMRLNELHKFSDGTLTRVMEKLDHMVKDFHLFEYNKGMENRKWSEDDKRRSKDFITAIEKRLQIRRIYRSLESFVGGRIRDIDYRLINRQRRHHRSIKRSLELEPEKFFCLLKAFFAFLNGRFIL